MSVIGGDVILICLLHLKHEGPLMYQILIEPRVICRIHRPNRLNNTHFDCKGERLLYTYVFNNAYSIYFIYINSYFKQSYFNSHK